MVISTQKMIEELQSLATTLATNLNNINGRTCDDVSKAFAKIDEFNENVQNLKNATLYSCND